ncbi:MAG: ATP-binding protein [Bradymonadales bacterium]
MNSAFFCNLCRFKVKALRVAYSVSFRRLRCAETIPHSPPSTFTTRLSTLRHLLTSRSTVIANIPHSLHKKIARHIANCSKEWGLIEEGDRIMLAYSGGKDSLLLLHFMRHIQSVVPFSFEIGVFHLNQSYPDFPAKDVLEELKTEGFRVDYEMLAMSDILAEKIPANESPCGLCSRLRRGILYTQAQNLSYNKIALGHHRDDAIETLLMNALYAGRLKSMPAKLVSDDKRNIIIRPMLYVPERLLIEASQSLSIPLIEASFCTRARSGQRSEIKTLLNHLEALNPKVRGNLLAALRNVSPSHLLDRSLFGEELENDLFSTTKTGNHRTKEA